MFLSTLLVVIISLFGVLTSKPDKFTEELFIKPLYSDHLYVHFQFATKWDTNPEQETCKSSNFSKSFIFNYVNYSQTHSYFPPRSW